MNRNYVILNVNKLSEMWIILKVFNCVLLDLQARTPKGWLLACNKNSKVGLVPANYLKGQHSSTGTFRVIAKRKDNLAKTSEISNASTSKVDVIPENPNELSTDVPVNSFVEEFDSSVSEVVPGPSVSEECNVENEEQWILLL